MNEIIFEVYDYDEFESLRSAKPIKPEFDTANHKFFIGEYKLGNDDYNMILIEEYFDYRKHECSQANIYCDNFTYEDYLHEKTLNIKYNKNTFKDKYKYWCSFYDLDEKNCDNFYTLSLII